MAKRIEFNENYFEEIDSEDKAYFLGFILADGCVTDRCLTIAQKDPIILEEFSNRINYCGNIYRQKDQKICRITVSSRKTISDLNKLGIVRAKTMIVEFPKIDDNLVNHFMRGVFDGDGCISIHKDTRDGNERGQVNICSGSVRFIESYVDIFTSIGIKRNKIRCPKGTYYVIDWGGFSDIEKIYEFLYKDATIYLKRKKETFIRAIDISSNKLKYRKS